MRTNRTCAHAAIADAAFVRSSSKFLPAMQHTPPKQPLKSEIKSQIYVNLSLRTDPTNGSRATC